jgi:UDP-N-acetylmuramoyl-tripeptide--D-alanyl-D-alanine ligase
MTAPRIALVFAFSLCYAVTSLNDYHMLQLNSYRAGSQIGWLRRNFVKGYLIGHVLALPILASSFAGPEAAAALSAALYMTQLYINRPRKAKKPLILTSRVKRMLLTNAVITAAAALGGFFASFAVHAVILAVTLSLSPVMALLSNSLNAPLEGAINRWYINDASKMIKDSPRLTVIGVTGSYGKTSTKFFLQRLLSLRFNALMTPESYNTTLGVVKTVRTLLKPTHEIFICEMGAKRTGEIKEICDIVRPKYGVITSIGPQHLESFGSMENIENTKFELAEALPSGGALFLNFDDERLRNKKYGGKTISYSTSDERCDYAARDIKVSKSGSSFSMKLPEGTVNFRTKLIGTHNVANIAAAIAVCKYLGMASEDAAAGVARLEPVPHRLQIVESGDMTIIDDSYNSNEAGAKAALDALGMFEGYKILVTPGMVELGEAQDECNRRFGARAAAVCDYVVLVGRRQTRSILEGLMERSYPEGQVFAADDLKEAFERINLLRTGGVEKVVLIENDLPDNY